MTHLIIEISKYIIILLIIMYTYSCFAVYGYQDPERKTAMLRSQNVLMFLMHLIAFIVLYLNKLEMKIVLFWAMQVGLFLATILLYSIFYPKVSRLVINNMCMLLCIGLIMLTRLDYDKAFKQFVIAAAAIGISLFVPVIIRKIKILSELRVFYGAVGIISLGLVALLGRISYGAKLGFTIAGISIQPSEVVKVIFVFFVASSFKKSLEFKNIVITTAVAALHVLILVASTDLGAALIIFVVYITMLYVATKKPLYLLAGTGAGALAAVIAYNLFGHIKVRVNAWRDPFASYDTGGYQVAQSLFALGTGSWLGVGLTRGQPETIPVAAEDFIFSAIAEELGLVFALCLILICVSVYIMFLNIAMELRGMFYRLIALGLGTCYIFQVFLTIGGVTKFIPSTGVTLPLVSYGGSSLLSTLIMFGIIQGLYILREDEEETIEKQKKLRRKESNPASGRRARH
ncbi:cell division protein FtsW (lipid II flippase) [Aequitasia blattaphilus]|uniref:FtsW/RodA/SpoVE family cell cycle protein n=1 Tax=Aequitasia blattaphilus TaxID=2949332 RepID=A0ABT1E5J9_9FIRM|nr:FtsW/RodA/SpoVE family cell cycle protein [Aequitasia blattaphilus]MCP1101108.1 FtsW/RodA/SpoVE family cell cycle protein [Aequitasia blattaphilus]MCR8613748.1 FtsW/RodA/SpoVE family cell cycle protein [Aequitasia blattaphilus]